MSIFDTTPLYNLSAVLRETGLKADVLRIWERRYQMPKPQRTSGGHRLYSAYDVAVIKWLAARRQEGLSISRAAELWKEQSSSGRDPLAETTAPAQAPGRLDALQQSWLGACLAFDTARADELLAQAFALHSVETVCLEILLKSVSQVGRLWYTGEASVQQEHFTTALAVRRIETLITAAPAPTRQTVLIGCPSGEWHSFSPLLLELLLRRRGLNAIYLGADIPLDQMEHTASVVHPALVILAAQRLSTASALLPAAELFHALGIPLAYGGHIFNFIPALRQRIPACFLGEDLDSAIRLADRLSADPQACPAAAAPVNLLATAARAFSAKMPLLEARMADLVQMEGLPAVNLFFLEAVQAALRLGSLEFLEADLEWVRKLLADGGVPPGRMAQYLGAFRHIVRQELETTGEPITEWVNGYLVNLSSNSR